MDQRCKKKRLIRGLLRNINLGIGSTLLKTSIIHFLNENHILLDYFLALICHQIVLCLLGAEANINMLVVYDVQKKTPILLVVLLYRL